VRRELRRDVIDLLAERGKVGIESWMIAHRQHRG